MKADGKIAQEQYRQLMKWGIQKHNSFFWLAILAEEMGELAKAMLEHSETGDEVEKELIHCAAVCATWLENYDTDPPDERKEKE